LQKLGIIGPRGGAAMMGIHLGRPGTHTRLGISRVELKLPRLPAGCDGMTVALVTDLHFGRFVGADYVRHVWDIIRREKPELVLMGGDFIDRHHPRVPELAPLLAELAQGFRLIGVPGNHDYFGGRAEEVFATLRSSGMELLLNDHRVARRTGASADEPGIVVVGLDDPKRGRLDVPGAFAGVPQGACVIVLGHTPDLAEEVGPGRNVDIMFAGHTHAGQVSLFGWTPVRRTRHRKYLRGMVPGPDFPVYVCRGLGVSGLPIRIGADPELAFFTLRRA
jgi:predicted MPP superfamily phosphohydrolase